MSSEHMSKMDHTEQRTELAYERSVEASNRTLMAGLRTSMAMISFGFAIFESFRLLVVVASSDLAASVGATRVGWALVIIGTVLLVMSLAEHLIYVRRLSADEGVKFPISPALVAAVLLLLLAVMVIMNWTLGLGLF